jgi:hypothetical protein
MVEMLRKILTKTADRLHSGRLPLQNPFRGKYLIDFFAPGRWIISDQLSVPYNSPEAIFGKSSRHFVADELFPQFTTVTGCLRTAIILTTFFRRTETKCKT